MLKFYTLLYLKINYFYLKKKRNKINRKKRNKKKRNKKPNTFQQLNYLNSSNVISYKIDENYEDEDGLSFTDKTSSSL